MYIPEKPLPLDFYKEEEIDSGENIGEDDSSARQHMLIEFSPATVTNGNCKSAKKRAETWAQDETRCLVCLRREIDDLFNTSKSNKHLWDQISMKMREKGFDRSSAMCTDKWRNLLKEYKKARNHHAKGSRLSKMSCYKEIDDILKERTKIINCFNSSSSNNNDFKSPSGIGSPYMQFTDKGIDDAGLSFGSLEACGRPILNLESRLDHDGNPLAIATTDTVQTSGVPPWNWRDAPGVESPSCGRVITVKWGDYTRRIGIDANSDAIKEAIKAVFGLRTRRAFWLEDVDGIVRSIDRDMPLGHYNLQLDEGIAIKVCFYDESNHIPVHTEDKTFYTNDDLHAFLTHRGWTCIRELDEYASSTVDSLNELRAGTIYRGVN